MKLLLVTCLVASAFAAPAERTKRNVLPGDSRYDAGHHHHHHNEIHDHHENEIEIARALGVFTGSFSVPNEISASTTESFLGSTDFLNHGTDANKAAIDSTVVEIGGNKVNEQSKTLTESSLPVSKVVSVSLVKPESVDLLSETEAVDADTESAKKADGPNVESKSASDGISSDTNKTTIKPATVDSTTSATTLLSDFDIAPHSFSTPFHAGFGSSFDSGFDSVLSRSSYSSPVLGTAVNSYNSDLGTFDQSRYNPSFQSVSGYSPSLDSFKPNYEQFASHGTEFEGFSSNIGSSLGQGNVPSLNSGSYPHRTPYLPPYSGSFQSSYLNPSTVTPAVFPDLATVTYQGTPSQYKFGSDETYLSPPFQQTQQQFGGAVIPQYQQQFFKNFNPVSLTFPTSASYQESFKPETKISESSSSGISQLTDANGGYIY